MDTDDFSIQPDELLKRLHSANAPVLLDVRRAAAFDASPVMLRGAQRCLPEEIAGFACQQTPREVVVYCVYGHKVGHDAAELLRKLGWPARYLRGGISGGEEGVDSPQDIAFWRANPLPTQAKS